MTTAQVSQTLMLADDAQRWNVAVDLVIDERLVKPGLMPEAHRAEVRKQLVAPLRDALSSLEAIQSDDSLREDEKSGASTKAAQEAVAGLDSELNRIERKYRIDNAQENLPPDLKRLQALTGPQAPAAGAIKPSAVITDRAVSVEDGSRGQQTARRSSGRRAPGLG